MVPSVSCSIKEFEKGNQRAHFLRHLLLLPPKLFLRNRILLSPSLPIPSLLLLPHFPIIPTRTLNRNRIAAGTALEHSIFSLCIPRRCRHWVAS